MRRLEDILCRPVDEPGSSSSQSITILPELPQPIRGLTLSATMHLLGRWTVKSHKNWQTFQKYLLPPIIRAIMEPLNSHEKLINFYLYTRHNIPEHVHLQFVAEIYEISTTYLSRKFLAGTWAKLWNNLVRLCQWVKLPTEIALMTL
jgi:hypothetical protein